MMRREFLCVYVSSFLIPKIMRRIPAKNLGLLTTTIFIQSPSKPFNYSAAA